MSEQSVKLARIDELLAARNLDALVLRRVSSFAWATCGSASYVNTAASDGIATLVITPDRRWLLTNTIEAPRLEREEKLVEQGWEFVVTPWHGADALGEVTRGLRLGADAPLPGALDLSGEITQLRARLLPEEQERFRAVGQLCAEAMDASIRAVRPGQTEYEISSRLLFESERRGVQPIVSLIATDERIFNFRHPIPTAKTLDRYAMIVLCARKWGLVCSLTRLVHFGPLPTEVRRKAEAVARIDAAFIAGTRPGRTLGDVFAEAQAMYAETGFADEWRLHHQGGSAAYEPREIVATPGSPEPVWAGQAFAWNPSITGAKSEDTVLVSDSGYEVITAIEGWPTLPVVLNGETHMRPAVLEE